MRFNKDYKDYERPGAFHFQGKAERLGIVQSWQEKTEGRPYQCL